MKLDIAPPFVRSAQISARVVAIREPDGEQIISSRFPIVRDLHQCCAGCAINGHVKGDHSSVLVHHAVTGNTCGFNVHAGAVIDVIQTAPVRSIFDSSMHSEIPFGTRRCPQDPPATGDKVVALDRKSVV